MQKSIKQQQETKLVLAQFVTLFSGLFIFFAAFYTGCQVTMDNPIKENMLVLMGFGSLVTLFSIFSITTNKY